MPAPLTAFEQRGHVAPWTSRSEEDEWIDDLLDYVDTTPGVNPVTVDVVGEAVQGNPMRLFTIGTGPRQVLHIAQQHGSELAGREAWFTTIREWVDSSDADLLDYLSKVTIRIMPTCHPDNLTARENVNGVNINRDHVELTQPETQAIHAAIRDHDPDLIMDWHEGANISETFATRQPLNSNADSGVVALADSLQQTIRSAIEQTAYTWQYYPANVGPETMTNFGGVTGRVTVLCESRRVYFDDTDAVDRHAANLIAIDTAWRWHLANLEAVAEAVIGAKDRIATNTSARSLQFVDDPTVSIDPLPIAYILTDDQWDAIALHRDRFGITGDASGDFIYVPTSQPAQTLILYLIDPASTSWITAGDPRYESTVPPAPFTGIGNGQYRIKIGGHVYPARLIVGGS